ncbi:MAG: 2-polyprenyl-6-methoxyphenol hydroxylase [Rhodospirillaceae bacterium]|jgi:2-polyprenyl-6-methoxyphenol hydroxylase-like FAD-dependent oxidoreductase|nr:2-polyprenyl-6-methoxyphenol hydroxylase [Rhodospirillaceae bacterium]MBT3883901.1 2-polyprenyl-6-methoxyphenol hydroxylase [Rhodospirillaceae bacterium]MBT4117952.1 2-polyprenyl-6-methoxyphenol hydroxylase [Rhodospirillaceae bacterium]MBT4674952.1 2-polyprenyl-6-methoxyphenol hydroxylase [Rhodospirillaceae bacterium]MBT5839858.1 2-polyprenyl-6-methoxyphenol hydroxylase [Rhodospirillaceae bacterium]
MNIETPVLIIGGGPVGLALSIELGWRGVDCVMVERRDGSVGHPKMNQVGNRTQEFCRRWGIGQKVRELSIPEDFPRNIIFHTNLSGHELGRYEFPARQDVVQPYSPEFMQRCSQIWFDPLLRDFAGELPSVTQMFNTQLDRFDADQGGVTAYVTDQNSGAEQIVRAQYMVACEGAESRVRDELGIDLVGDHGLSFNINIFFKSTDSDVLFSKGRAVMQWFFDETGLWADIVSINGKDLWRLSIMKLPAGTEITEAEGADYLRKAAGTDLEFEILSILPWDRKRVVAERYHEGRIFLAGDAVHQMSPTGGFGMNTGIQEAVDIGWKLAAVLDGWGGDNLLRTYDLERRPVARMITDEGARNFTQFAKLPVGPKIDQDTSEGDAFRKDFQKTLYGLRMDREYDTNGIVLGYRYEGSPIIVPDGTPEPEFQIIDYTPTARPGHRAPHAWIGDGEERSTLDLFGRGFALLRFDRSVPVDSLLKAAGQCAMPMTLTDIDQEDIARLYARKLVLVRPDGHVAWRGDDDPVNAADVIDIVRGAIF